MRVSASKRVTRSRADSAYAATKPATPLPMTATERSKECIGSMPGIRNRTAGGLVRYVPPVSSTFFRGGTIWTGVNGQWTDALLVIDGAMPSFGDGHAHPLPGGLEAVGPQVRQCKSVDEIVAEVKRFAVEHPDDEWIVGASYESSMAPAGLFDARWLDAAVADRPIVLRAWDYHTVWCNSVALERAGITADTADPVLGEIPRREDGSPLGTLREWGAVDLVYKVVPEHDPKVRVGALRTAAED